MARANSRSKGHAFKRKRPAKPSEGAPPTETPPQPVVSAPVRPQLQFWVRYTDHPVNETFHRVGKERMLTEEDWLERVVWSAGGPREELRASLQHGMCFKDPMVWYYILERGKLNPFEEEEEDE